MVVTATKERDLKAEQAQSKIIHSMLKLMMEDGAKLTTTGQLELAVNTSLAVLDTLCSTLKSLHTQLKSELTVTESLMMYRNHSLAIEEIEKRVADIKRVNNRFYL